MVFIPKDQKCGDPEIQCLIFVFIVHKPVTGLKCTILLTHLRHEVN